MTHIPGPSCRPSMGPAVPRASRAAVRQTPMRSSRLLRRWLLLKNGALGPPSFAVTSTNLPFQVALLCARLGPRHIRSASAIRCVEGVENQPPPQL